MLASTDKMHEGVVTGSPPGECVDRAATPPSRIVVPVEVPTEPVVVLGGTTALAVGSRNLRAAGPGPAVPVPAALRRRPSASRGSGT